MYQNFYNKNSNNIQRNLDSSDDTIGQYWTSDDNRFNIQNYINPLICGLHGGLQGYTMNYSDEMIGSLGGAYGAGKALATNECLDNNISNYYQTARNQARTHLNLCNKKYPWITGASEITGAVLSPVKFAGLRTYSIPTLGAFAGFGAGEGGFANQLISTGIGVTGAKIGKSLAPWISHQATIQIKPTSRYIGKSFEPYTGKNYSRQFGKGMTAFVNNPYLQTYLDNGLDYISNKRLSNMYNDSGKTFSNY